MLTESPKTQHSKQEVVRYRWKCHCYIKKGSSRSMPSFNGKFVESVVNENDVVEYGPAMQALLRMVDCGVNYSAQGDLHCRGNKLYQGVRKSNWSQRLGVVQFKSTGQTTERLLRKENKECRNHEVRKHVT